ncbi:MAG: recombination protein RecR [Gemmatimonadetes bacterium 13_1_40CM_4_69_8]|nr:MAG: recombination protein RecR [Gemmatimonadetes bacterium 13_1_40CM_70_15]OLC73096.1 MAG: recombination protein RecR [Gemmatimonadetes bacterium 13_1_40CM_4_69_8]PYP73957.1 MAG: recombination protein RecR [Gemmatimonadota bacterium]
MSAIEDLVTELSRLPGIGRKTAQRLTFHLLKQPAENAERLAQAIRRVREQVIACGTCGNLTDEDPCAICRDPRRDTALLCVVEEATDVAAIERAARFRGRYHVLGGRLSPLDGLGPEALHLERLLARVGNGSGVREVIVATNPSMEGEVTATYLQQVLRSTGVRVTRIARGLPMGGDLEYADGVTIAQALEARRDMSDAD